MRQLVSFVNYKLADIPSVYCKLKKVYEPNPKTQCCLNSSFINSDISILTKTQGYL